MKLTFHRRYSEAAVIITLYLINVASPPMKNRPRISPGVIATRKLIANINTNYRSQVASLRINLQFIDVRSGRRRQRADFHLEIPPKSCASSLRKDPASVPRTAIIPPVIA